MLWSCVVCAVCGTLKKPVSTQRCLSVLCDTEKTRVHVQNVPMCTDTTRTHVSASAWCQYTRGRERTHVDVSSGHTEGVFIGKPSEMLTCVEHINQMLG